MQHSKLEVFDIIINMMIIEVVIYKDSFIVSLGCKSELQNCQADFLAPKSPDPEPLDTCANLRHIGWNKAWALEDRCFKYSLRR